MRFGLYSELQCHPWQTYDQVYGKPSNRSRTRTGSA